MRIETNYDPIFIPLFYLKNDIEKSDHLFTIDLIRDYFKEIKKFFFFFLIFEVTARLFEKREKLIAWLITRKFSEENLKTRFIIWLITWWAIYRVLINFQSDYAESDTWVNNDNYIKVLLKLLHAYMVIFVDISLKLKFHVKK